MNLDGMTQLATGFYRVRVISNTTFSLVDLDTRENINSTSFSDYTASSAEMWVLEGIQNEFYRKGNTSLTVSDANPQSQSGLTLFYKDPKIALSQSNQSTDWYQLNYILVILLILLWMILLIMMNVRYGDG